METPTQVKVNVLVDEFDADEIETAAREWAQKLSHKHDYFLAFKADKSHIKIVARVGMVIIERLVTIT